MGSVLTIIVGLSAWFILGFLGACILQMTIMEVSKIDFIFLIALGMFSMIAGIIGIFLDLIPSIFDKLYEFFKKVTKLS